MIYAIGDIHGQLAMLERALALIAADGGADAPVVFVGDYTDRGPDSRGVLDLLIAGRDAGRPWTCLRGNHDQMFLDFLRTGAEHDPHIASGISWHNARMGGDKTLASYGVSGEPNFLHPKGGGLETLTSYQIDGTAQDPETVRRAAFAAVPDHHMAFLDSLDHSCRIGPLFFAHAGVRPGVALTAQDTADLMWIREPFLSDPRDHGALIIHGHTALDHPQHHGNRVNLDGGAGYGRPLYPALIDGHDVWLLTDEGRVALPPPA